MKKIILAVLLSSAAFGADRVMTDLESSIKVYKTELNSLPDGGCSAQAYARITQSDGGTKTEGSRVVEVSGANRTTCLDILDTKAPALFKSSNGF